MGRVAAVVYCNVFFTAFYTTNRVMTCSFHKFGEYFPGTGDVKVPTKLSHVVTLDQKF